MVNHGGNWNSTAPSFSLRSGSRASKKVDQRYSTASGSRSFGYTRCLPSGRISSGSDVTLVGCCVKIENALMLNVKLGGVRWAHCCTTCLRVGWVPARLEQRLVGPRRGADEDAAHRVRCPLHSLRRDLPAPRAVPPAYG